MVVGFVAALLSFGILKVMGEPAVDRAIAFESAMDEAKAKAEHDAAVAKGETPPPYEEEPELVSRPVQGGIGLFTGVTVYSIAFGGLFALAFAILYGRMGDWSPRVTAALLALSGFLAIYAVPILKYPANPPSIGNPDTIGLRTAIYFGMILLSLGSMIAAWSIRNRLIDELGAWNATLVAAAVFVVAVGHFRSRDAALGRDPGRASRPTCCGSSAWLRSAPRRFYGRCSGLGSAPGSSAILPRRGWAGCRRPTKPTGAAP